LLAGIPRGGANYANRWDYLVEFAGISVGIFIAPSKKYQKTPEKSCVSKHLSCWYFPSHRQWCLSIPAIIPADLFEVHVRSWSLLEKRKAGKLVFT